MQKKKLRNAVPLIQKKISLARRKYVVVVGPKYQSSVSNCRLKYLFQKMKITSFCAQKSICFRTEPGSFAVQYYIICAISAVFKAVIQRNNFVRLLQDMKDSVSISFFAISCVMLREL